MMKEELDGYWYLREGDLRPVPLTVLQEERKLNKAFFLELWKNGCIFTSREDADKASNKFRKMLKKRVPKQIYLMWFDDWSINVLVPFTKKERPANWLDTLRYVRHYLINGKGLFICGLISVLTKALTFSLKPTQVFGSKEGANMTLPEEMSSTRWCSPHLGQMS